MAEAGRNGIGKVARTISDVNSTAADLRALIFCDIDPERPATHVTFSTAHLALDLLREHA
jgi:hypothetical protein